MELEINNSTEYQAGWLFILDQPAEFAETLTFMRRDNEKNQKNKSYQGVSNCLHENAAKSPQFPDIRIQQGAAQGNQRDSSWV